MASGSLDILGRSPQVVQNAYTSDAFRIAIAGPDHGFMMVQRVDFSYGQQVSRIFDLEDANFQAYVAARPQGQFSISNIVADIESMVSFMQTYGDVCSATSGKNITFAVERRSESGICKPQSGSLSFSQPVLVNAALGVATADYLINQQMGFLFASVNYGGRG